MKSLWIALALALSAGVGAAQDDPPAGETPPPAAEAERDPEPPAAEPPTRRDPTAGAGAGVRWQGPGATQVTSTLPPIALKARVFVRGRPPAALVQIDQTLHLVREGSAIALPGLREETLPGVNAGATRPGDRHPTTRTRKTTLTLKVTSIDAEQVVLEVPGHDPLILR